MVYAIAYGIGRHLVLFRNKCRLCLEFLAVHSASFRVLRVHACFPVLACDTKAVVFSCGHSDFSPVSYWLALPVDGGVKAPDVGGKRRLEPDDR